MATGAGVRLQGGHRRVIPYSQPGLGRRRQVKEAPYRETLQTTGRTTRILNRLKRVCVNHQSGTSVTRDQAGRERAHYPTSRGPCDGAFIRHGGIFRPDVVSKQKSKSKSKSNPPKPGAGVPPSARHPGPVQGRDGRNAPYPSFTMSSGRLFLDRVARQHCPSPLHRHPQTNMPFSDAWGKGDISTLPGGGHFYFALTAKNQ